MRLIAFLFVATASLLAQRPRYGGTLVVETAAVLTELDASTLPPHLAALVAADGGPFHIAEFAPGQSLVLSANEECRDGRPYLDSIEIRLGRPAAEQLRDFELGRAQVIELLPGEVRRQQQRGRRVWASPPFQLIALVWDRTRPAADNSNVRQALALTVDREPMWHVLLQRQGEFTGALLPQWLGGYAFLFPTGRNLARARQLANAAPSVTLECPPSLRQLADRIVLNARDAGLAVRVVADGPADLSLVRIPIVSADPVIALEALSKALGVAAPQAASLEEVLRGEREVLAGDWIVPLFHTPTLLGIAPSVRDTTPPRSLRWRLEDVWIESQ